MTFMFVLMAHELAKCNNRKLNVADFHSKHKGKYSLSVNIIVSNLSSEIFTKKKFLQENYFFHRKNKFRI